jgi:hypothetical protein
MLSRRWSIALAAAAAAALGSGASAAADARDACVGVSLELVRPAPGEPVMLAAGELHTRLRVRGAAAAVEDAWWVCFELRSLQFDAHAPTCLPAPEAALVRVSGLPFGQLWLRLWAQLGRAGAPCTSSAATALRPVWVSPLLPAPEHGAAYRCGADAVPWLPGACAWATPQCAARGRSAEGRRAGGRPGGGQSPPAPDGGLAVVVLVHRGGRSLAAAARSWRDSGLLAMARRRVVFLQEWQHAASSAAETEEAQEQLGAPRGSVPHSAAGDARLAMLPAGAGDPAFEVIGARRQRGIAPALVALVRHVRDAEHVLFLEEDFAVAEGVLTRELAETLAQARDAVRQGAADLVKLRHRTWPGRPFFPWAWQGRERELFSYESPYVSNHSLLDTLHWLHDPVVYFFRQDDGRGDVRAQAPLWRCGARDQLFCAYSSHQGWTNNPWVLEPAWFLRNIAPAALADWTRSLEGALGMSPHLWDDRCFVVAQGQGLFTHRDLDKPAEAQSPSEDPFGPVVVARKAALEAVLAPYRAPPLPHQQQCA